MKSIVALLAVAFALASVSALACDGSGAKMKSTDKTPTSTDKKT